MCSYFKMKIKVYHLFAFLLCISIPWAAAISCENKTYLDISKQNLNNIDEFVNCENLKILILKDNNLTYLDENIFRALSNLEELDLSYNNLKTIPNDTFTTLHKLQKLYLDNNHLEDVTFLSGTKYLQEFSASFNKINNFHSISSCDMKKLNLSHNLLSEYMDEFNNCIHLVAVDFSFNKLTKIPDFNLVHVRLISLNLSHNEIKSVTFDNFVYSTPSNIQLDLQFNLIEEITVISVTVDQNENEGLFTVTVYLDSNPFDCSKCETYNLAQYFYNKLPTKYYKAVDLRAKDLYCVNPKALKNVPVMSIKPEKVLCKTNVKCIKKCQCFQRKWDNSLVIDCSYQNFTELPSLLGTDKNFALFNKTELNLTGNFIKHGPKNGMGYDNITTLDLSNNQLETLTWVPQNIQVLHLDNNKLDQISFETIKILNDSNLEYITLHKNKWDCRCEIVNFTNFIRQHSLQVFNEKEILCDNEDLLLINVSESSACTNIKVAVLTCSIILVILILSIAMATAIFYKYNYHIKVWLYSHGLCLNWLLIDSDDKDRPFDAFVSYAEDDEGLVLEKLCTPLEQSQEKYKLCLQFRDGQAGELRHNSVNDLIEKSKRTIIFLSQNFLQNVWSLHEFRAAHIDAMNDPNKTVIIIIYKGVDIGNLDKELETYLKTNTYVEWDDQWFWKKIRYAMPHIKYSVEPRVTEIALTETQVNQNNI